MSLRQLTRRLGRGSLSGFWQGRYTLQPWNEVANSHAPPPESQGKGWDSSGDYGFATFSNVTNPSIGLDSIYQKHVYSRLAPLEAPEAAGDSNDSKGEAIVAAAVFATLQPAAAAAAQKGDDSASAQKGGQKISSRLDTDLTADSVAVVIEGALDRTLTEDSGAPAAAAGAASRPIGDPHVERNALNITAAAPRTGSPQQTDPAAVNATPHHAQPMEKGGSGSDLGHTVQASSSGQAEGAATAPAVSQDGGKHMEHLWADTDAALTMLPPTAARGPDLAIGLLWALPEEARDTITSAKTGAAVHNGGSACMEKDALLASSLAHAAGRNTTKTRPCPAAANGADETKGAARAQTATDSTAAVSSHSSVCRNRSAVQQAPSSVKLAARVARQAGTGAVAPRQGRRTTPAAVARLTRSVSLDPRDSAAERHAESVRRLQPSSAEDEMFLWQSQWRLGQLLDRGSLKAVPETSTGRGVLPVQGSVCGRPVFAYCLDAAASENASCADHASRQILHLMDMAVMTGHPVIAIYSGSASPQPSHGAAIQPWADLLLRQMDASGVIPQLSVNLASPPSSEAFALLRSTADFTFTVQQPQPQTEPRVSNPVASSAMQYTSSQSAARMPDESPGMTDRSSWVTNQSARVTDRAVTGRLSASTAALAASGAGRLAAFLHAFMQQSLGLIAALVAALQCAVRPVQATCEYGPAPSRGVGNLHRAAATVNQVADGQLAAVCSTERDALRRVREVLMYLPASNISPAPTVNCLDSEQRMCQKLDALAADLHRGVPVSADLIVRDIVDGGNVCQLALEGLGSPAALGFARLGSRAVGILAFPPLTQALHTSPRNNVPIRAARFVRFCDAFNMPVVTLLLPHLSSPANSNSDMQDSAQGDSARALTNLIFAFSEATVPKLTVVMGAGEPSSLFQCLRSDVVLAWSERGLPSAAEEGGAVRIIEPCATRAALCAELAVLLQPRVVARPRRKHALLPL